MYIDTSRTVPEVFDIVREQKTKEEKVKYLKAYRSKALLFVIDGLYNVDWSSMDIPKFEPNHRPPGICNLNINNSITRIKQAYLYANSKPEITKKLLSIVLEEVSKEESKLLVDMFNGKKVQGISKSVFKEAYPEFFRFQDENK